MHLFSFRNLFVTLHTCIRASKLSLLRKQLPFIVGTLSYIQSAITASQRVHVATIEILFANNCRTYEICDLRFRA